MIINENEHELDCSTYFNGNNLDVIFPLLLSSDQEKDELLLKQFQKDAIGLGYFVNSLWIWKHCHYSIKSNKSMENYQEWMNQMGHKRNLLETTWIGDKLKYKHLVIVGDFISRLYFLHLSKILKEYKKNWQFESSRKSSNENMELFLKDFSISWYHHGLPILHNSYLNRIWSIEEIFNNFIEFYKNHDHRVPSHLLINFDNLFATFPHDYYEHRLSSIVHSLIELMRRLPYIRVMYRGSDRQMMVDERIHLSPLNLKKMNYINKSLVQLMNAKFVRLMHHTLRNETFHLRERFIFIYTYSLTELDVNCTNLYEICENALIHQLFQILQHL
ncbi:hypothetical protein SNEBB_000125 [Seison nebaliae]|nr:hypothetical protein SNEBB_000125 [Seison nebaliae]